MSACSMMIPLSGETSPWGSGGRLCKVEMRVYSRVVSPASSNRSLYAYMTRPPASASERRSRRLEMYAVKEELEWALC